MEFEEAQKAYDKAHKAVIKASNKFQEIKEMRDMLCPHTNIVARTKYYEGGYFNNGYEDRWTECVLCGAKSAVKRSEGGFA